MAWFGAARHLGTDKDILQITLINATVEETTQIAPDLVLDYGIAI
jgi:hypothetical protein